MMNSDHNNNNNTKLPKRASQRASMLARHSMRASQMENSHVLEEYLNVDPSQFTLQEYACNGQHRAETKGKVEVVKGKSIMEGLQEFRQNPAKYTAILYPTPMLEWPEAEQQYTLIHRAGTTGLHPLNVSIKGKVSLLIWDYQPLPSFPKNELPHEYRDQFTDHMIYHGQKCHSKTNQPLMPGRGMGLLDQPNLQLIDSQLGINPSSIKQGKVGNCWLLSGIAALAEFDGAIEYLFRKTPHLQERPYRDGRPNTYTITLWDLPTMTEVDIVVDERLAIQPNTAQNDAYNASMKLVGAKPSDDGQLWVCYLEKALACHLGRGNWEALEGGYPTHAWSLLTGNINQFHIQRHPHTHKFQCWARYDCSSQEWLPLQNAPNQMPQHRHELNQHTLQLVEWPDGTLHDVTDDELFAKLSQWDDANYLMACASPGTDDRTMTNGIVDNHAYAIVSVLPNVASTGIDLIQIRNPWGKGGGVERGLFAHGGKGWKKYPPIAALLQPPDQPPNDGLFWLTKDEFFQHYVDFYVCAQNMQDFLQGKPTSPRRLAALPNANYPPLGVRYKRQKRRSTRLGQPSLLQGLTKKVKSLFSCKRMQDKENERIQKKHQEQQNQVVAPVQPDLDGNKADQNRQAAEIAATSINNTADGTENITARPTEPQTQEQSTPTRADTAAKHSGLNENETATVQQPAIQRANETTPTRQVTTTDTIPQQVQPEAQQQPQVSSRLPFQQDPSASVQKPQTPTAARQTVATATIAGTPQPTKPLATYEQNLSPAPPRLLQPQPSFRHHLPIVAQPHEKPMAPVAIPPPPPLPSGSQRHLLGSQHSHRSLGSGSQHNAGHSIESQQSSSLTKPREKPSAPNAIPPPPPLPPGSQHSVSSASQPSDSDSQVTTRPSAAFRAADTPLITNTKILEYLEPQKDTAVPGAIPPPPTMQSVSSTASGPQKHFTSTLALPTTVTATFSNTGQDPTMANAELYYESTKWASFGHQSPPVTVSSFPGHRWFIVANGIYAKQFTIASDGNLEQAFTI